MAGYTTWTVAVGDARNVFDLEDLTDEMIEKYDGMEALDVQKAHDLPDGWFYIVADHFSSSMFEEHVKPYLDRAVAELGAYWRVSTTARDDFDGGWYDSHRRTSHDSPFDDIARSGHCMSMPLYVDADEVNLLLWALETFELERLGGVSDANVKGRFTSVVTRLKEADAELRAEADHVLAAKAGLDLHASLKRAADALHNRPANSQVDALREALAASLDKLGVNLDDYLALD